MEITMKIKGMMCAHCSGRVKNALEKIDGVSEAVVSHEKGTAVVKGDKLDPAVLKAAVEDQGYDVVG